MNPVLNILLVEDDPSLGFVIKDNLTKNGYQVYLVQDGENVLNEYSKHKFSACILDIMLPKKDGFDVAIDLKKVAPDLPIIFLTAKSQLEDKIKAFNSGADDYVTKPFKMEELLLRLQAVLKRTKHIVTDDKQSYNIGKFTFDYKNRKLLGGEERALTKKEAELLKLLCMHKNSVLERNITLSTIWGKDDYFNGRSMDVFITKLRKYLRTDPNIEIQNVHGIGFKLTIKEA